MPGFDDFIRRVNTPDDTPVDDPTPAPRPPQWEYRTEHTDAKRKAKVLQRMTSRGWEYVEETKNPLFALRPPLALTFRRPK